MVQAQAESSLRMPFTTTRLKAAVVDAANMWAGFGNWVGISTPEMKMIWSVANVAELRSVQVRADVLFITTNERRGENLGYMILSGLRYAKQVVIAARYYSEELVREVKQLGAAGAVRAGSDWRKIFKEAYVVLGINQTPSKIAGKGGKPVMLSAQEAAAMRLYRSGVPLMLIGSQVDRTSSWVEQVLIREGLRHGALAAVTR